MLAVYFSCNLVVILHCHVTLVKRNIYELACLMLMIYYQLRITQGEIIIDGRVLADCKICQGRLD
jgi:hypothetical protein